MSRPSAGPDCARCRLETPGRSAANYGTTLFFTTHYLEEAQSHCDRIAIMHLGKLDALGTCTELEASLGGGSHTLDEVFVHYAGSALDSGGNFHDVSPSAQRPSAWASPTL